MHRPVSSSGRPDCFRWWEGAEVWRGERFWIEASVGKVLGWGTNRAVPEYLTRLILGWSMTSSMVG